MTASLGIDFTISIYLLYSSIPSYFFMTYPPSAGVIESAIVFSTEFSTFALKKWRQDFLNEFEIMSIAIAKEKHDSNQTILRKSKLQY